MNVEQITPAAAAEIRAARKLATFGTSEIAATLYLGRNGQRLTHVCVIGLESSGWILRGGYDMHGLDELALQDLEAAPQLSAPVTHAGCTHMHVDWMGDVTHVIWLSTPFGPEGFVLYPPNFMGDGNCTHDAAIQMMDA